MKIIFLLLLSFSIVSCSKDESKTQEESIYGEWVYESPSSTATEKTGIIVTIKPDGTIWTSSVQFTINGSSLAGYMRLAAGNYTRNGEALNINYTYETCYPTGSETIHATMRGGKLFITIPRISTTIAFSRIGTETNITSASLIEDKGCNMIGKGESKNSRSIASLKKQTVFERAAK